MPGAGVGGVEGAPRGADLPVPSRLLSHSPALRGLCWAAPNPRGPLTEVLPTVTISKLGSLVQGMPKAVELRVNAPQSTAGRRQHLPGPPAAANEALEGRPVSHSSSPRTAGFLLPSPVL